MRVGLNIVEKTVSSSDDVTLLDPASGSSNYQAPGADRYKIGDRNIIFELFFFQQFGDGSWCRGLSINICIIDSKRESE